MKKKSRQVALAGMMTALAVVIMLLGGVIPLATFCCPALAGLMLLPVLIESGRKWALSEYAAIAILALLFSPDKESALLFAFLGYYPVLKTLIDRKHSRLVRILLKLLVFNAAAGLMLLSIAFVFQMEAIIEEYAAMTGIMAVLFVLLANVTMLIYDRLLDVMAVVYVKKLRPKLKFT